MCQLSKSLEPGAAAGRQLENDRFGGRQIACQGEIINGASSKNSTGAS